MPTTSRIHSFWLLGLLVAVGCSSSRFTPNPAIAVKYPPTTATDSASTHFGTQVPDPFRWLEDDNSPETAAWVKAQNEVTEGYLGQIPYRDAIRTRLTELVNYPRYSAPLRAGEYIFFYKNDGLQNQSVIYRQKGQDGTPEVFIDPNQLSKDGTLAISLAAVSKDNRHVVVNYQQSGSDWNTLYVYEVATGKQLSDKLEWVKFSGASWYKDGFYYSRFPTPAPGTELTANATNQAVYYHKVGTPQSQDKLVFERLDKPRYYNGAGVTEDERFLIVQSSPGTYGSELFYQRLDQPGAKLTPLLQAEVVDGQPVFHEYGIVDSDGDNLLMFTDHGSPKGRIVRLDPTAPAPDKWQDVIAEREEPLSSYNTGGGSLFVSYLKDATTQVSQFDYQGKLIRAIELPTLGNAGGFGGRREEQSVYYTFSSFNYPPTIFRLDVASGASTEFRRTEVKFTPADYTVEQVKYPSKDGTLVPMFLIYKKGLKRDGTNPVLLYGYGGFNISLTPGFNPYRLYFAEVGGIWAVANLRGGGEYGEEWHKAGMLENKQNVFDDFIAAAEYLVREKYTAPQRIAISGGSNGGLLVGAAMTQKPELFGVALPAVGVMDMLRFHKFSAGFAWSVEYGNADSTEAQFKTLYAYSPLHNLKPGTRYPATLVTTADHDNRVVPAHSFKFAAQLQKCQAGDAPTLIRIETDAGHGAGKPISKTIDEYTDVWAFTLYNLGVATLPGAAAPAEAQR
ncbi:MAG: prolyl oligopeptidase family serine peptidase [Bacteroidia bacterium]|nr:prolyl oligopeptidase family serine peptidase [Bacteroidia bacterium]